MHISFEPKSNRNCNERNPGRNRMEILHVALMFAGKLFDKTWKIQTTFIEKSHNASMQHGKFCKNGQFSFEKFDFLSR